ncbi:MAG: 30S ribosomal protein S20 [Oscillospiraceae bacterium]|jgi:small subunit ribosomal protein S20|nr:30S ribosomal protein S20 [Oscillospiraceae bacterium]
MPNIKSSAKRDALSKARNASNRAARSKLRTTIKKFDAELLGSDSVKLAAAYKATVKAIDRAASKGLIHKNNAAHRKSRIAKAMNKIGV